MLILIATSKFLCEFYINNNNPYKLTYVPMRIKLIPYNEESKQYGPVKKKCQENFCHFKKTSHHFINHVIKTTLSDVKSCEE